LRAHIQLRERHKKVNNPITSIGFCVHHPTQGMILVKLCVKVATCRQLQARAVVVFFVIAAGAPAASSKKPVFELIEDENGRIVSAIRESFLR
jgi:hypothetical protein